MTQRDKVLVYAEKTYGTKPEYLWARFPGYAVLRHTVGTKWYGIIMDIPAEKLNLKSRERIDILEIKCDPVIEGMLRQRKGILPAYHMKKGSWLTVLLDGTLTDEEVFELLDLSFDCTSSKSGKGRRITEWIVPANTKYFDIDAEIAGSSDGVILWKQSSNIQVGDTVYMYLSAPVSAIRYKCVAVEVNIPYEYHDEFMSMTKAMRLKVIKKYDGEPIGIEKLRQHGVNAVRGPRSIPRSLVEEIELIYDA